MHADPDGPEGTDHHAVLVTIGSRAHATTLRHTSACRRSPGQRQQGRHERTAATLRDAYFRRLRLPVGGRRLVVKVSMAQELIDFGIQGREFLLECLQIGLRARFCR